MGINDSITVLKGVGPKKAGLLSKLNINTIEDLLFYYPRDYEDRRNIKKIASLAEGDTVAIRGKILLVVKGGYGYGKKRTIKVLAGDETGRIEIIFFHGSYLEKTLKKDIEYEFFGKVSSRLGRLQMIHPDFSIWDGTENSRILPVYPLTQGLTQSDLRKWQSIALKHTQSIIDYLPEDIIERNRLCDLWYAIENIHFPNDPQKIKESRFRLVFDELFIMQLNLLTIKTNIENYSEGIVFDSAVDMEGFTDKLPFPLTGAQKRVIKEINMDMESSKVMNRLVHGDVGSGKTAVAAAAMYKAVKSGFQAVMMAPTELLARQHFDSLNEMFRPFSIKIGLLTGSMTLKDKKQIIAELQSGEIKICVGTHAVIQPNVSFSRLGLVITDEQHRFGVNQRGLLADKGSNPDVLVMTATPIPRTLAVVLYGDLDISAIDEMPPGRKPVITKSVDVKGRASAYDFVRNEIKKGRQAYVVAPLIDESTNIDTKSATELYNEINDEFKGFNVGLLHGGMKQTDKDAVMERFYTGDIDILVATVVIEVGINVPNATIMLIENADRFGLATLHQLRGRVGRGEHSSYCILVSESKSEVAEKRIKIMEETNNGFVIAEKDLELRGPGEFFGMRQHGMPDLKLADLIKHIKILETARNEVTSLLNDDPLLSQSDNYLLKQKLTKTFENFNSLSI